LERSLKMVSMGVCSPDLVRVNMFSGASCGRVRSRETKPLRKRRLRRRFMPGGHGCGG
jgi:hypothetical protein